MESMSVLETVKETVGLTDEKTRYECDDCGHTFHSDADSGSYWFQCPECKSESLTELE